ncbi:hypothetical protein [Sulfitobacter sp. PS-8MA]|uniref:hypothetical protein n=1 Tax=Sulfitobacter sp. PS-8MA TaxID=3237707 RepID=UPI0034C656E9
MTSDIPRCIDQIERLTEAIGGPQAVCRLTAGQTLAGLIASPDGAVFTSGGGFIAAQMGQTTINPERIAVEHGWFAEDRSGLRLLRQFERWSSEGGASLMKVSCKGGAAQRILERRGYAVAEVQMVKKVG